MRRAGQLRRLREEEFDVVVVGGGITGAAVARDAARRGFRTGLLEAGDYGQGTSSRSSRLVHGGLRYLEHLELGLVFEASRERRTLLRIAPHLVRPMEFLFPVYRDGRVGRWKLDAGMWLYDLLSLFRNIERHRMLDVPEVLEREPGLRRRELDGGARYFDAQVDDARLVLATVVAAHEAGAAVANRVEAVDFGQVDGTVRWVGARDRECGREWRVAARCVVSATGPWADRTLERGGISWKCGLRPTRGSHVHVPRSRAGHERALIFESPVDGRIMFVLPWGDLTMIGTTDEDHEGGPSEVAPTAGEVEYLLASANGLLPGARLVPDDVVSAWAGLRPLVADEDALDEEEVSRDFAVTHEPAGLFTVAGGKLTSHRAMAEAVTDRAARYLRRGFGRSPDRKCDTDRVSLPGGDVESYPALLRRLAREAEPAGLPPRSVERLARAHGSRAGELVDLAVRHPELGRPVVEGRPYLAAEVVHAVREEMALHAEDVLYRRTHLGRETREAFPEAGRRVVEIMGRELGWDAGDRRRELARAREVRRRDEAWRSAVSGSAGEGSP